MHKTDHFLASKSLYAVNLSGLTRTALPRQKRDESGLWVPDPGAVPLYRYEIPAVWFKRRHGSDTSNIGYLWDITFDYYVEGDPGQALNFLKFTLTDGRYGGHCQSRWDDQRLWSEPRTTLEEQTSRIPLLTSMLRSYPSIPDGYDGWWHF